MAKMASFVAVQTTKKCGDPDNARNPNGDNRIKIPLGNEAGLGLLASSAIDQHVNARDRETDLGAVTTARRELFGIGIDQSAAIVVGGNSFFSWSGQVVSKTPDSWRPVSGEDELNKLSWPKKCLVKGLVSVHTVRFGSQSAT